MKKFCTNCISFCVCKYAEKRAPDLCRFYLFRSNPIREIMQEHERRDEKWEEQNYPMLGSPFTVEVIRDAQQVYKQFNELHSRFWFQIIMEEIYEAFAETEPEKQREEMIRVAAVAVQIIERLDRRINEAKGEKDRQGG